MNIAHCERPDRVFSSTGQNDLTSNNAKFFAYPVQSESTYRESPRVGYTLGTGVDAHGDFNRFAFKALPIVDKDGLWFSAHIVRRDDVFDQAWDIYTEAFTDFERRSLFEQMHVMRHPHYRFSAIRHEDAVVGMVGYWELPGFCFVEHVAVSAAHRSGGYGRRALQLLQQHSQGPILVDVEPFGTDQFAARRVTFYNRLGFHYCGSPVTLPPYAGKTTEPSNLMAWPMALDRDGREQVVEIIRRDVYGLQTFRPRHNAV